MKLCRSCEERRRILAQAGAKQGTTGVVRALPKVVKHMVRSVTPSAKS